MAQVWPAPAATAMTGPRPVTATGVRLGSTDALPSCPRVLAPQQRSSPDESTAQEWAPPELTAVTPVSPATCKGYM